jgi:hypothetical protein
MFVLIRRGRGLADPFMLESIAAKSSDTATFLSCVQIILLIAANNRQELQERFAC